MFVASHALSSTLVCTCAGMSPSISSSSSGVFPSAASNPSFFVVTTRLIPKSRAALGPPRLGDLFEIECFTYTVALRFEAHRVNDLVPLFSCLRQGARMDGLCRSAIRNEYNPHFAVERARGFLEARERYGAGDFPLLQCEHRLRTHAKTVAKLRSGHAKGETYGFDPAISRRFDGAETGCLTEFCVQLLLLERLEVGPGFSSRHGSVSFSEMHLNNL